MKYALVFCLGMYQGILLLDWFRGRQLLKMATKRK
jgi:hypothetical protein